MKYIEAIEAVENMLADLRLKYSDGLELMPLEVSGILSSRFGEEWDGIGDELLERKITPEEFVSRSEAVIKRFAAMHLFELTDVKLGNILKSSA